MGVQHYVWVTIFVQSFVLCLSQVGVPLPNSNVAGPGSLMFIENPHLDKSVEKLLIHPVLLSKLQKETNADTAIKIESVLTAHKQVAAGTITYLDLKVRKTICPVGVRNAHRCENDVSEDPYVCEVAIWERPWINSTRIIAEKSKCAETESDTDFKNWEKSDTGFQLVQHQPLVALPSYISNKQVSLEAFDYVDRGSDSKFKGRMVNSHIGSIVHDPVSNVTTIETKIEYGFTFCLKFPNMKLDTRVCPPDSTRENYICTVTVVSAPGLTSNLKVLPGDDDDIECEKRREVKEDTIVPIKGPCSGCPEEKAINSPSVLQMADFALNEFDRTSDEDHLHRLIKIIKAQTQVVSGIKYILTVEIQETNCVKALSAYNMNRTFCEFDVTEESKICKLSIWEQPWIKFKELIEIDCEDKETTGFVPVKSQRTGRITASKTGRTAVTTKVSEKVSASMQQSINDFVVYINQLQDADDGYYKLLKIHDASVSTERGEQLQNFVIELGETICRSGQDIANCPLKPGEDNEMCAVVVSLNSNQGQESRSIISVECDDADEFIMKSVPPVSLYKSQHIPIFEIQPENIGLPGGPVPVQSNSTIAMEIAQFIVNQYNLQEDEDEYYKLGKIISIYSQALKDIKYMIELELMETQCKKYQPVTDVSACPVKEKEDSEICQAEVFRYVDGQGITSLRISRLYCDDTEDFYKKKIATSKTKPVLGHWTPEDFNSEKAKQMGRLMADEFDARSDKDNIFVMHKILDVKSMDSGLKYLVKVELAETVCPKYKRGIDKSRCAIDIGEDLKICEANVVDQPWRKQKIVEKLICHERDESGEDLESREVLYPDIHPTAHSRPKFLSVFQHRGSKESDESNEKYYQHGTGRLLHDSDEHPHHHSHELSVTSEANSRQRSSLSRFQSRRETTDSDHDSRSREIPFRHSRHKRKTEEIVGGAKGVSSKNANILKVAQKALLKFDQTEGVAKQRKIKDILQATSQVVAGIKWVFTATVVFTVCDSPAEDLSLCEEDLTKDSLICTFSVYEIPWQGHFEVQKAECHPDV